MPHNPLVTTSDEKTPKGKTPQTPSKRHNLGFLRTDDQSTLRLIKRLESSPDLRVMDHRNLLMDAEEVQQEQLKTANDLNAILASIDMGVDLSRLERILSEMKDSATNTATATMAIANNTAAMARASGAADEEYLRGFVSSCKNGNRQALVTLNDLGFVAKNIEGVLHLIEKEVVKEDDEVASSDVNFFMGLPKYVRYTSYVIAGVGIILVGRKIYKSRKAKAKKATAANVVMEEFVNDGSPDIHIMAS